MILVTGGTGLLGSHLLLELVRDHQEVVALKRPSSDLAEVRKVFGYYTNEAEELFRLIDWVDADLLDDVQLEHLMLDVDQVYHCAAKVSFQPRDAATMIAFNQASTRAVVNASLAAGVKRFMFVSSSSTIGRPPEGQAATESLIYAAGKTNTSYSLSKFKAEMEVWRGVEEGLPAVIVNPVIILGPGFWGRGSSALFRNVASGLKFTSPGLNGFVGVYDVVDAMVRLMETDVTGERYILSAGDLRFMTLLEMMATSLGEPRQFRAASPRMLKTLARLDSARGFITGRRTLTAEQAKAAFKRNKFSADKIKEAIGFSFTPLDEVVERICRIYLEEHRK
jgi:nucleoside-diphosphate-sugar epimerase